MKCIENASIWRAAGLSVLALGFVACASTGPERSEKAVDRMSDTHAALTKVRKQVDRTLGSLAVLMSAAPADLRKSFDAYAKDVDSLQADADDTKKNFEKMKEKKHDYLAAWEKERGQVKNEELRQLAESRRAEVGARLDRAVQSLMTANEAFRPLLSNLGDVRKVLGNDLTPNGQALVASTTVVQNAHEQGTTVGHSLDSTLSEIEYVAKQLSSTGSMN